jgi:hypothetical protein
MKCKPIKELLIQYYRVMYNPNLSFEGQLLERINYRGCSVYVRKVYFDNAIHAILSNKHKEKEYHG